METVRTPLPLAAVRALRSGTLFKNAVLTSLENQSLEILRKNKLVTASFKTPLRLATYEGAVKGVQTIVDRIGGILRQEFPDNALFKDDKFRKNNTGFYSRNDGVQFIMSIKLMNQEGRPCNPRTLNLARRYFRMLSHQVTGHNLPIQFNHNSTSAGLYFTAEEMNGMYPGFKWVPPGALSTEGCHNYMHCVSVSISRTSDPSVLLNLYKLLFMISEIRRVILTISRLGIKIRQEVDEAILRGESTTYVRIEPEAAPAGTEQ